MFPLSLATPHFPSMVHLHVTNLLHWCPRTWNSSLSSYSLGDLILSNDFKYHLHNNKLKFSISSPDPTSQLQTHLSKSLLSSSIQLSNRHLGFSMLEAKLLCSFCPVCFSYHQNSVKDNSIFLFTQAKKLGDICTSFFSHKSHIWFISKYFQLYFQISFRIFMSLFLSHSLPSWFKLPSSLWLLL